MQTIVDDALAQVTSAREQISSVADVLSILESIARIAQEHGAGDRQPAVFNRIYLGTTRKIHQRLFDGRFRKPEFVERLDIEFARRYLSAVHGMATMTPIVSQSWRISYADASPLALAAAAVNAHVNLDLAFALLSALAGEDAFPAGSQSTGTSSRSVSSSPEFTDFQSVNEIFRSMLPATMAELVGNDRWLRWLYDVHPDARYGLENAAVRFSRDAAWWTCETRLWPARGTDEIERTEADIDHSVAELGRLIIGRSGRALFGEPEPIG